MGEFCCDPFSGDTAASWPKNVPEWDLHKNEHEAKCKEGPSNLVRGEISANTKLAAIRW